MTPTTYRILTAAWIVIPVACLGALALCKSATRKVECELTEYGQQEMSISDHQRRRRLYVGIEKTLAVMPDRPTRRVAATIPAGLLSHTLKKA